MNMPKWAKYILEVSTAEEGGPYSDFSFEAKLDDLQWFVNLPVYYQLLFLTR